MHLSVFLELCADVYRRQSAESQSMADEMISLMIGGVGCSAAVRTHTMEFTATLAGVTLKVIPLTPWSSLQLWPASSSR